MSSPSNNVVKGAAQDDQDALALPRGIRIKVTPDKVRSVTSALDRVLGDSAITSGLLKANPELLLLPGDALDSYFRDLQEVGPALRDLAKAGKLFFPVIQSPERLAAFVEQHRENVQKETRYKDVCRQVAAIGLNPDLYAVIIYNGFAARDYIGNHRILEVNVMSNARKAVLNHNEIHKELWDALFEPSEIGIVEKSKGAVSLARGASDSPLQRLTSFILAEKDWCRRTLGEARRIEGIARKREHPGSSDSGDAMRSKPQEAAARHEESWNELFTMSGQDATKALSRLANLARRYDDSTASQLVECYDQINSTPIVEPGTARLMAERILGVIESAQKLGAAENIVERSLDTLINLVGHSSGAAEVIAECLANPSSPHIGVAFAVGSEAMKNVNTECLSIEVIDTLTRGLLGYIAATQDPLQEQLVDYFIEHGAGCSVLFDSLERIESHSVLAPILLQALLDGVEEDEAAKVSPT